MNDASTDGTREAMEKAAERPEVRPVHLVRNGGQSAAIVAGIDLFPREQRRALAMYTLAIYNLLGEQFRGDGTLEGFDWSRGNAEKIWRTHRVSWEEAEQVFENRPLLTKKVTRPDIAEERWLALGASDAGRRLFLAYTMRGELIRVISARDMSRRERREYSEV